MSKWINQMRKTRISGDKVSIFFIFLSALYSIVWTHSSWCKDSSKVMSKVDAQTLSHTSRAKDKPWTCWKVLPWLGAMEGHLCFRSPETNNRCSGWFQLCPGQVCSVAFTLGERSRWVVIKGFVLVGLICLRASFIVLLQFNESSIIYNS